MACSLIFSRRGCRLTEYGRLTIFDCYVIFNSIPIFEYLAVYGDPVDWITPDFFFFFLNTAIPSSLIWILLHYLHRDTRYIHPS